MNTRSLQCVVQCDRVLSQFITGIFAADEMPNYIYSFPSGFIVNTDTRAKLGRHWLAFYISSKTVGEFFDSYGHSPSYYSQNFQTFFNKNGFEMKYNNKKIQSDDSKMCGQYCIYYLMC